MAETLKHTPLYAAHLALGARMVPFGGWEMPVQYGGIMEEHRAVRTCAGSRLSGHAFPSVMRTL